MRRTVTQRILREKGREMGGLQSSLEVGTKDSVVIDTPGRFLRVLVAHALLRQSFLLI